MDRHAVLELLHLGPHFPEVLDGGGDAVRFLHAEFAGVADVRVTLGQRGGDGDYRDLVDQVRDFLGQQGRALERCAVDLDVANRLASGAVFDFGHVRAHAAEDAEDGGAGRVQSDVLEEQAGAIHRGRRDQPEGG